MKILLTFHPGVQFQRILATLTNLAKENGAAMATKIEVIDSEDDERGEALVTNLRQRGILVENYDDWAGTGDNYQTDPTAPFTLDELADAQANGRMSAEEAKKDVMAEKADGSPIIGDESASGEVIPKRYEGDTDPDSTEDQKQAQADADAADDTDTERTSTGPASIP